MSAIKIIMNKGHKKQWIGEDGMEYIAQFSALSWDICKSESKDKNFFFQFSVLFGATGAGFKRVLKAFEDRQQEAA